jgi:GT2 family glycosyltransferase
VIGGGLGRGARGALLLVDAATVVVVAAGWHGPARVLLALAFASFVPGGALLARHAPSDAAGRLAAVVALSWAVTVLVNDALIELAWWDPEATLVVMGVASALLLAPFSSFWARSSRHAGMGAPRTEVGGDALVSVVVCTRDRPEGLATCLASIQASTHPHVEIVVVDNAPSSGATAEVVARLGARDKRVRYVVEPRPGLSRARNRGVREARGEIVAFTDDDATVEPSWVDGIVRGFRRDASVGCVTGPVPAADLTGEAQQQFERRVSWSASDGAVLFDLQHPPDGAPLFPYAAGQFGTGANMALRRAALEDTGPFDEALGAGSRARGGEDLDMFVRVLRSGWAIAHEPSAVVWHAHRADPGDLRDQLRGYGVGLTAYLTKHLTSPRAALGILRRLPRGLRHGHELLHRNASTPQGRRLRWAEATGMAYGPLAYVLGRLARGHA